MKTCKPNNRFKSPLNYATPQKKDPCWLNMFIVAQKRNMCLQKLVLIAYKYMLNWLRNFCVARKILWCRKKLKMMSIMTMISVSCDDNDDAICFLKWNLTWSTRAIHLCSSPAFLSQLKFWFAKILKMNLRIAPTEMSFCKSLRPCKNSKAGAVV